MSNVEKIDTNKGPSSKAIGKMLRTSPIKLNDAIKSIRGKNVGDALSYLEFSKKRISNALKDTYSNSPFVNFYQEVK